MTSYLNLVPNSPSNLQGSYTQVPIILVTNQDQNLGFLLPEILKLSLANLKRSILIVNCHFRICHNLFLEDIQKMMFVVSRLKNDIIDAFFQALKDDLVIILYYDNFLANMSAVFTPSGAWIQDYLLLLRLL